MDKRILIFTFLTLTLVTAGCIGGEDTGSQKESNEPVSIAKVVAPLGKATKQRGDYTPVGKSHYISAYDVPKDQLNSEEERKEHIMENFSPLNYKLSYDPSSVEVPESKLNICRWNHSDSEWKKIDSEVKPSDNKVEFQFSESGNAYAVCHQKEDDSDGEFDFSTEELPSYMDVGNLKVIGGKIAYHARTENSSWFIVHNGEEIGKEYDKAWFPHEVNNKLAFSAEKDEKEFIVYNGEEREEYSVVGQAAEVNGKLTYAATEGENWFEGECFIVYNGNEGKRYDTISQVGEVNGKLTYLAEEDGERLIVYGDKKIGASYDSVSNFDEVKGQLVYRAEDEGKDLIVYNNGTTLERVIINKFLGEIAGKATYYSNHSLYQGNQEIGKEYFSVSNNKVMELNGKLSYKASKQFQDNDLLIYGDKEIELKYPVIISSGFVYNNGKIYYLGSKEVDNRYQTILVSISVPS